MHTPDPSASIDRRFLLGGLAGAAGVAALANLARGGPLTPPAGAVAPSGKTLTEVEPRIPLSQDTTPGGPQSVFTITQPGSYYLTANVAVPSGQAGIRVALAAGVPERAHVEVNLMGFEVAGGQIGVELNSGFGGRVVVLRNGRVRDTAGNGVQLFTGASGVRANTVVEDVWVTNAGGNGIAISGGVVRRCTVETTALTGITVGTPALIESCLVVGANNGGFYCGSSNAATVRGCIAAQCQGSGAALAGFGVVEGCEFYRTGLANTDGRRSGVYTFGRGIVRNNVIDGSPVGVETAGARAMVTGNIVSGATVAPYVLAASTLYGPIVNLSSVATAAVNGSSAPGVLTTADPNANYVH